MIGTAALGRFLDPARKGVAPRLVFTALFLAALALLSLPLEPGESHREKDHYPRYAESLARGRLWIARAGGIAGCPYDTSFYDGKCYPYWGIVPAVLRLAIPGLTTRISCALAAALVLYFLLGILESLARELAPDRRPSFLHLTPVVLLLAWGSHVGTSALVARVYEEAILVAAALGLGGLYVLLPWLAGREEPLPTRRLLAGGALLGLAALTRGSWFLCAGGLALFAAGNFRRRGNARAAGIVLTALGLALALQMWLNWVRFDHPLDTGFGRNTTNLAPVLESAPYDGVFSLRYLARNLAVYFFLGFPPWLSGTEPYALPVHAPFQEGILILEFACGLFLLMPGLLLCLWRLRRAPARYGRLILGPVLLTLPLAVPVLTLTAQVYRYQLEAWLAVLLLALPYHLAQSGRLPRWEARAHWASAEIAVAVTAINSIWIVRMAVTG